MAKVRVNPGGDDRLVPKPDRRGVFVMSAEGTEADTDDQYIMRRLKDGDLVLVTPPAPPVKKGD